MILFYEISVGVDLFLLFQSIFICKYWFRNWNHNMFYVAISLEGTSSELQFLHQQMKRGQQSN